MPGKAAVPVQIELVENAVLGQTVGVAEEGENVPPLLGTSEKEETSPGIERLEGVDLRAELFIAKIREQMRRELQQRPPP